MEFFSYYNFSYVFEENVSSCDSKENPFDLSSAFSHREFKVLSLLCFMFGGITLILGSVLGLLTSRRPTHELSRAGMTWISYL